MCFSEEELEEIFVTHVNIDLHGCMFMVLTLVVVAGFEAYSSIDCETVVC